MSLITEIADAVAAQLNAAPTGTFDQAFEAKRRVLPVFDLEQLADMQVSVVPKRMEITGSTRVTSQYDIAVDIGVQQRLSGGDTGLDAQVAVLGTLVDQITDYLRRRKLAGFPWVSWVSITNEPVYAPDHLAEQRVFTSVLTVTYRAMK